MTISINDSSVWLGSEIQDERRWTYCLSPADIGEINEALSSSKNQRLLLEDMTKANFPLPSFSNRLKEMLDEDEDAQMVWEPC